MRPSSLRRYRSSSTRPSLAHVECRQGGPPVRRLPQRAPQEVGGGRAESGPEGLRDEVQGPRQERPFDRLEARPPPRRRRESRGWPCRGRPRWQPGRRRRLLGSRGRLHRSRGRLGLDRAGWPSVVRDVGGRPPRALLWLALGPAGVERLQGLRAGFPELDIRRSPVGDLFQAPARELVTDLAERGRAACPDGVVRLRLELLPQCSDRLAPAHGPQCADRTPPLGEGKLRAAEHPCEVRRCRGVLGREHRGHRHLAQVCVAVVEQRVEQLRPGRQLVPGHVHRREVAHVPVTVGDGGEVDRDPLLTGERPGVLEQRPRDVRGRPGDARWQRLGLGSSASSRRAHGSPASCGDAAMQSRSAGAAALEGNRARRWLPDRVSDPLAPWHRARAVTGGQAPRGRSPVRRRLPGGSPGVRRAGTASLGPAPGRRPAPPMPARLPRRGRSRCARPASPPRRRGRVR